MKDQPRWFGVDLASGPDRTATYRTGYNYKWTVEDLERCEPDLTRYAEERLARDTAALKARIDADLTRAMYGNQWSHPGYSRPAVEIITDPNDRRGFDARPVVPL